MNTEYMTPAEEFEFYSRPENLRSQGPAQRRSAGGQVSSSVARRSLSCLASDARMAMRSRGHITRHSTPVLWQSAVSANAVPAARPRRGAL